MVTRLLFGKRFTTGGILLLVCFYLFHVVPAYAQTEVRVRGKVLSETGEEIPGVTVRVKDGSLGTVTDSDGNYSIRVPNGSAVLVFSLVGNAPMEIPVDNRESLNVTMKSSATELSETVIVGYGAQKKLHMT